MTDKNNDAEERCQTCGARQFCPAHAEMADSVSAGRVITKVFVFATPLVFTALLIVLGYLNKSIGDVHAEVEDSAKDKAACAKQLTNIHYNLKRLFEYNGIHYIDPPSDEN